MVYFLASMFESYSRAIGMALRGDVSVVCEGVEPLRRSRLISHPESRCPKSLGKIYVPGPGISPILEVFKFDLSVVPGRSPACIK
jgi:hypothetical protein